MKYLRHKLKILLKSLLKRKNKYRNIMNRVGASQT